MKIKIILLLIILQQIAFNLFAQPFKEYGSPFIKHYSSKEYNVSSQVFAAVQDNRGVMYFGDTKGICEFDGSTWKRIDLPKKTSGRSLAIDNQGTIYVGSYNEFGFLQAQPNGETIYISLSDSLPENERVFSYVWQTFVNQNGVYFISVNKIFKYFNKKITSIQVELKPWYAQKNIDNKIYLITKNNGICYLNDTSITKIDIPETVLTKGITSISNIENNLLIGNSTTNINVFDFTNKTSQPLKIDFAEILNDNPIYFIQRLDETRIVASTKTGKLIIFTNTGKLLQIIDKTSDLDLEFILSVYFDISKNLWLTSDHGIYKIDLNFPAVFFDANRNINEHVLTTSVFENKRYIGTFKGLYYLSKNDTDQNISQKFIKIANISASFWTMTVLNNTLFCGSTDGLYAVNDTILKMIQLSKRLTIFDICAHPKFKKALFVACEGNLKYVKFNPDFTFKNIKIIEEFTFPEISNTIVKLTTDSAGNIWANTKDIGIYFIRFHDDNIRNYTVTLLNEKNGLIPAYSANCYNVDNKIFACNEKGIYEPVFPLKNQPDSLIKFVRPKIFGEKINISLRKIIKIEENKYLFSDGSLFYVTVNDTNVFFDNSGFRRITKLNAITKIFYNEDKTLSIGCSDKYINYDTKSERNFKEKYYTAIRKVTIGIDSTIFNGTFYNFNDANRIPSITQMPDFILVLEYKYNSITLNFSALFFEEPQETEYQYFLEGFSDKWTNWSKETKAVFTNLNEGKYVFKVKAKNVYGTESEIADYRFKILPPWYRTIWAYTVYLILLTGFIYMIVKLNTKRLVQQKEQLEMIVKERTAEISQQKEELQTQAEYLQQANNELTDKNNEISIQRDEIQTQKNEIEKRNTNITASITYASYIQKAMLWRSDILDDYFSDNFILFKPRDIVSGDFYYIQKVNDYLIIVAADCTGHGVPGAFMSVMGFMFVNDVVAKREITKASDALEMLRENIKYALQQRGQIGDRQDGMDLAFIAIHLPTLKADFAGANNPLWLISNNELTIYKGNKQPIGIYLNEKPFTNQEIQLQKGDKIYLFSDGYYSQFGGEKGRKMKLAEFQNQIKLISNKLMHEQKKFLEQFLEQWKGTNKEQIDDILVIGVTI